MTDRGSGLGDRLTSLRGQLALPQLRNRGLDLIRGLHLSTTKGGQGGHDQPTPAIRMEDGNDVAGTQARGEADDAQISRAIRVKKTPSVQVHTVTHNSTCAPRWYRIPSAATCRGRRRRPCDRARSWSSASASSASPSGPAESSSASAQRTVTNERSTTTLGWSRPRKPRLQNGFDHG